MSAVALAAVGSKSAAAPPQGPERLRALADLLLDDGYQDQRPFILSELAKLADPCGDLAQFSTHPSERVRENAVRTLDAGGCADFTNYRPFLGDRGSWVVVALTQAARHQRLREAVPYLIDRLDDQRRIIREDATVTVGAIAREALTALTCHSFADDPPGRAGVPGREMADWKGWYEQHRDDPGDAWTQSGIARARDELAAGNSATRIEALRTLALCGAPAAATLRGAFDRRPGDLRVTVACTPDEPPRVGDEIPCVLELRNVSQKRVALAPDPDGPAVSMVRETPAQAVTPPPRAGHPAGSGKQPRGAAKEQPPPTTGADEPTRSIAQEQPSRTIVTTGDITAALVDLEPGEVLRREFRAGPVSTAGRYEVRAVLRDFASDLAPTPPITGSATLRIEQ